MGTSVGDSESEAESLSEHAGQRDDAQNPVVENGEENAYNYAAANDDESEDSSSSSEESEEDDFMKDRQTDEDYSAYRERIFDFTPKGYRQKKSLVEEIKEDTPSTSGVKEIPASTSDAATEKKDTRREDAFNFQQLVQHMSKAEGMTVTHTDLRGGKSAESVNTVPEHNEDNEGDQEETASQQNNPANIEVIKENIGEDQEERRRQQTLPTKEDDVSEGQRYMDRQRRILVDQATERVKKSNMSTSSLTFEEYVTSLDRPPVDVSESVKTSGNMTKNIARGNASEEADKPKKQLTLKDIMKETNVINAESDSDDSDSSEDEETVTGNGDGHPVCRLRKPEEIEAIIKGVLRTSTSKRTEGEVMKAEGATIKDDEETFKNEPSQQESKDNSADVTEDDDYKETIKDINVSQMADIKNGDSERNLQFLDDIPIESKPDFNKSEDDDHTSIDINETSDTKHNSGGEDSEVFSNEPTKTELDEDEPENDDLTGTNRTPSVNKIPDDEEANNGSEESDASSDDQQKPYYRKLDKSEATIAKQTDEDTDAPSTAKTKQQIKEELTAERPAEQHEEQDSSYREMLKWNLRVPDQNVQILSPITRTQSQEDFRDELCDMLARTKRQDKPEFEVTPPRAIAEENDKIMYPKNTKESICSVRYKSVFTQKGAKPDVKPPLVHKVLKLSQNYPVFQKNSEEVIQNEVKEESNAPENALAVSNKISEVREYMAQFTKNLEEFNERSRLAREEVIKDYNTAVERELKIVDKIMGMRQHEFDRRYTRPSLDAMKNRRVDHIDDNVLRKHFEDMDMILEEDSSDSEEELKAAVEEINREVFKDFGQQVGGEGEYELSKVPREKDRDDEEEKKDEEKGTVSVDNDSYEEYLTTNEDEGEEDSVEGKIASVEDESNVNEKSGEEYFITNEDQEEYFDACSKYEGTNDESITETGCQQLDNLVEKNEEESNAEEENDKESAASLLNEKETDDNPTVDGVEDKYEKPVIKRNINCSLEMQLAKKTDEGA